MCFTPQVYGAYFTHWEFFCTPAVRKFKFCVYSYLIPWKVWSISSKICMFVHYFCNSYYTKCIIYNKIFIFYYMKAFFYTNIRIKIHLLHLKHILDVFLSYIVSVCYTVFVLVTSWQKEGRKYTTLTKAIYSRVHWLSSN